MSTRTFFKQFIVSFIILLLGILAFWGLVSLKKDPEQKIREREAPLVNVQVVKPQAVAVTIESQGNIQARRKIDLISEVSGRVTWISPRLQNGILIEDGELLLTLDDINYEAAVAKAKADTLSAQLNHKDRTARYQSESLTVKQAAAEVDAAKKNLEKAQNDLSNTQITAPFSAIVETKIVDLGQYVSTGNKLFELVGTDQAEVRLPVQGNDIHLLRAASKNNQLNLPVMLHANIGSETLAWPAHITYIEASIDKDTRVSYVVATIDKPYEQRPQPLSLGLFVRALIDAPALAAAVVLPRYAVHQDKNTDAFVFLVTEENLLKKQSVEIARTEKELVVVVSGILEGDRVLVTRLEQAYEDLKVTVQEP